MNKQTYALLSFLINAPMQTFSYEELAALFSVSSRSIRNYVSALLDFLQGLNSTNLLSCSEKGVSFHGSTSDSQFLLEHVIDDEFYLYRLSPEERQTMIFLKLLLADEPVTLAQFMEHFNAGRTTILKDMEQIRYLLVPYHLSFPDSLNRGYYFDRILEEQRRSIVLKLLYENSFSGFKTDKLSCHLYRKFLLMEYPLHFDSSRLEEMLLEAEKTFHVVTSDENFNYILLLLILITIRTGQQHFISNSFSSNKDFQNLPTYKIAFSMIKQISEYFSCKFKQEEVCYLAIQLYHHSFYDLNDVKNTEDMRLHIAVTDFILRVSRELQLPVYDDAETCKQLERHLKDITNAYYNGIRFENEYVSQLISQYETYYLAIKKHISILENYAGYSYDDNTISFILMYIIISIEHYFQDNVQPDVIVVCHTGIGTANFLAQRLSANFRLHILAVTSNHQLPDILKKYPCDLIISTIQLSDCAYPWIKVAPILKDTDILQLQKKTMEITLRKQNVLSRNPAPDTSAMNHSKTPCILKAEHILLDVFCENWEEAVFTASAPLIASGAVTEEYPDAIITSAKQNGAYFVYCPHVALIHAGPNDGIRRFGISLLRLKVPVCFGHAEHDPVSFVLCMAASKKDPELPDVLKIMEKFSIPEFQETLQHIKEPEQMISYLFQ